MSLPAYVTADDLELGDVESDPWPWMADGVCQGADQDVWFPGRGESFVEAVEACGRCPVARECLDYAIAEGIDVGVFGGLTPGQRRREVELRAEGTTLEEHERARAAQLQDDHEEAGADDQQDESPKPDPEANGHEPCPTGYHDEPCRACYSHGCRCDGCREANATYEAERRAEDRERALTVV